MRVCCLPQRSRVRQRTARQAQLREHARARCHSVPEGNAPCVNPKQSARMFMFARHSQGSCNTKCAADQRREPSRQSLPADSRARNRPGVRPQASSVTVGRVPPVPVAQRRSSLRVEAGHPTLPYVQAHAHHLPARWIAGRPLAPASPRPGPRVPRIIHCFTAT